MVSRLFSFARFLLVACLVAGAAASARADEATDKARAHYETGLELFYARQHAQALIEFQRAHEIKPRPATVFMMGQCEYLLGSVRDARDHYEAYLRESPTGEFVEVAKDRIESINRRPATLVINTVPDAVDVRITPAATSEGEARGKTDADALRGGPARDALISGQAPNNFAVPRGRWVVSVSKANYLPQQTTIELEIADTKPLFFKLDPIPARLEIETVPANAALYVNGNRVVNPGYSQNVPPGRFEVRAEATDYQRRTDEYVLGPGDRLLLLGPKSFQLRYVQRSGRPELVFASALMGGLVVAGAIAGATAAAQEKDPSVSSVSFTLGGAVAGTIGGALVANGFVPAYIPDNRALFVIGGMWIGAAEGSLAGIYVRQATTAMMPTPATADQPALVSHLERPHPSQQLKAAFVGSLPGIIGGTTAAALMTHRAPTYGRVALIQSAAAGGAVVGALTAVALKWTVFSWQERQTPTSADLKVADPTLLDLSLPALIGLNVGLAGGLLGAYLPDQSRYGPSWQRVVLVDMAAGAGALAAGIGACVSDSHGCLFKSQPDSGARARTARIALLGAGAGLVAGIFLTRNVDRSAPLPTNSPSPSLSLLPMPDASGKLTPLLGAFGFF